MVTIDRIDAIQSRILDRVVEQVLNGQQSKLFPDEIYSCGQFLELKDKNQRGVHGTSSALRIIAESASDDITSKSLAQGLIYYLENRLILEKPHIPSTKVVRDDSNVIKVCETLYSLSFIKAGVANPGAYIAAIHEVLSNCQIEGKGWSYFIYDKKVKILPTAFAVMGLKATGFDVTSSIRFLEAELKNALKNPVHDPTQFAKYMFALYVLVYSQNILKAVDEKRLKGYFKRLIESPVYNLVENLEQNIEYWPEVNDTEHEYIRIPWQLYFIAIAVKISPWHFSKIKTQKLLETIETQSLNGGFMYSHSGPHLSTRTQSILFDVLSKIKYQLNKKALYSFFNILDRIASVFRSKVFRCFILITVCCLFGYSLYKWISKGYDASIEDLGPEIAGPILLWIYNLTRNPKK
jgi:hypothetical protein